MLEPPLRKIDRERVSGCFCELSDALWTLARPDNGRAQARRIVGLADSGLIETRNLDEIRAAIAKIVAALTKKCTSPRISPWAVLMKRELQRIHTI